MLDAQKRFHHSEISALAGSFEGVIGSSIVHLSRTSSTQDVAREMAISGDADAGTVVVADEQTSGRGRFGRKWMSGIGEDVLMSVVLTPRNSFLGEIMAMASLACALTVEDLSKGSVSIKWPNDVLLEGEKICGLIAESFQRSDEGSLIVILGVGLNVNFRADADSEYGFRAASLNCAMRVGEELNRKEAVATMLIRLNELYSALERGETIVPEWKSRLETLGKQVVVFEGGDASKGLIVEGLAEDVDEFGRLLVRSQDGSLRAVSSGEASLREHRDRGSAQASRRD